jgi:hypothetical protein
VEYLTQPDTDWLVHDISFPILREVSRAVYNYFNLDAPYFENALPEAGDEDVPESEPELPPQNGEEFPQGIEAFFQGSSA